MFAGSMLTRWWFQFFSIFTPWGRWTQFDKHMVQRGWWTNHQLVKLRGSSWQFHFFTFWLPGECLQTVVAVRSPPALCSFRILNSSGKMAQDVAGFVRWMSLTWGKISKIVDWLQMMGFMLFLVVFQGDLGLIYISDNQTFQRTCSTLTIQKVLFCSMIPWDDDLVYQHWFP